MGAGDDGGLGDAPEGGNMGGFGSESDPSFGQADLAGITSDGSLASFDADGLFNTANDSQAANASLGLTSDNVGDDGSVSPAVSEGKGFFNTPLGIISKGLLTSIIASHPIGQAGLALHGLFSGNPGQAVSAVIGGIPGAIAGMGVNGVVGNNPTGGQIGSLSGGQIGGAIAGPIGGMIGSTLGGMAGEGITSNTGVTGVSSSQGQGGSMGDLGGDGGLVSLYQLGQEGRSAGMGAQYNGGAGLDTLYGPNSPYAAQLRQQLERRDAAAGRRSQFGPREVELQAKLAEQYGRSAPGFMNAQTQRDQFSAQQRQLQQAARGRQFNTLYGMFRQNGGVEGLQDMIRGRTGGIAPDDYYSSPGYTGPQYNEGSYNTSGGDYTVPQYEQPLDFSLDTIDYGAFL